MPVIPTPYDVLASDSEREAVADALRGHAGAGRLDTEELDQRLERAYEARLRADLLPLLADLPAPAAPAPRQRRRVRSVPQFAPLLVLALALVVIWALTGAGYFWPIWPIGALALSALKHGRVGCHGRAPSTRTHSRRS